MNKKILITLFLVFILIANVVFAADSLSVNSKDLDKEEVNVEESKVSFNDDKKQEILEEIEEDLEGSRETAFFDNIIVQGVAQFNDYTSMVEAYAQLLYVDELYVENLEVQDFNVDNIFADDIYVDDLQAEEFYVDDEAYINNLEVEDLEVEELYAEEANVDNLDVDNLDVDDEAYIDELYVDNLDVDDEAYIHDLQVNDLEVNELRFLGQTQNNIAFACLDEDNVLFRSNIPCNELNGPSPVDEVEFSYIGQVQNVFYEGSIGFEVELVSVSDEEVSDVYAVFNVDGDYEFVEEGETINIGGLVFELQNIEFSQGQFEELVITLEGLGPLGSVMMVDNFPFNYEFDELYQNLRFDGADISIQDIEIIAASDDEVILEVNDEHIEIVEEGDNISIGGIEMYINSIESDDEEFESIIFTVYGVDEIINPIEELNFYYSGQTQEVNFFGGNFEITLDDVYGDNAIFIVNGDYGLVEEGSNIDLDSLSFSLEEIDYDNNGYFQSLTIVLQQINPIEVEIIMSYPYSYQFEEVYENFRFEPDEQNIPMQDIEILGASSGSDSVSIQLNDANTAFSAQEGVIYVVQGISFVFDSIDFNGNELVSAEIDILGVTSIENVTESPYPGYFISNGEFDGLFVVGANSPTADVVFLLDIVADINESAYVPNDVMVLDTSIEDIEDQSIITVGTACDNTVIAELLGNPVDCDSYEQEGVGLIYMAQLSEDIHTLVVDGYDSNMRGAATEVLLNLESYEGNFDLTEGAICVEIANNALNADAVHRDYILSYC